MKKLLAAVTSIVMSTSFVTSAFASSFNVSAAGGVSAVQPNVSMGEVIDGAADKNAVQNDFVVTGTTLEYNLGDAYTDAYIDFKVESGGHKGSTLVFEVDDLPAGITYSMTEKKNLAIPGKPTWSLNNKTYNCECRDSNQDPQNFEDGGIVCTLTLDIPSNISAGEYDINLSRFHVVEQGSQQAGKIIEFDAKVVPGKVIIKGDGTSDDTNPPSDDNNDDDNNNDSSDVMSDFVVTGSKLEYNLGDAYTDAYIDFTVQSGGHKGSTLVFDVATLPAGIKYSMTEKKNLAIPGKPTWSLNGNTYNCECRDANQDPQNFDDGEIVCTLTLDIPSDIAAGEYDIDLKRFHVVEQGSQQGGEIIEFDAKVVPGKVIIKDSGNTTPTTPSQGSTVDSDTTTPDDFSINGSTLTYTKGDDYSVDPYIDFVVKAGGHKGSTLTFEIAELPAGITAEVTEKKNYAIDGNPNWVLSGSTYRCECRDTSENPQSFKDGATVVTLTLDIPSTIAVGEYDIDLSRFHVVEQGSEAMGKIIEFDANVNPGKLIIKEAGASNPDPTEPVIPPVDPAEGEAVWVIDTVKGTPGKSVEVPVFVKGNSTLEVAGATFEIAANGADFNKVAGPCAAYGNAAIVNNANTNEFAFAQAAGQGSAAADKAVIMTLTYDVPANATGTIPVEWANVTVSDTNGNLITEKVKVENGAIIIKTPTTTVSDDVTSPATTTTVSDDVPTPTTTTVSDDVPTPTTTVSDDVPADVTTTVSDDTSEDTTTTPKPVEPSEGEVLWVIDTVKGTPGKPVEVPVFVKGNSTLEVAGATFTINSEAGFNKVSGSCAAYGNAAIVNNAATSEYAFAQAAGQGSAAADKAVIMVITYDVPADATGTIPVTWANVTVSDTNGNLITEKVKLENGAIIIDVPTLTTKPATTTTVSDDVPTPTTTTTVSDDVPTPTTTTVSDEVPTLTTKPATTTTVSDDVPTPTTTVSDDVPTPTTTVSDDVPTPTTTTVSDDVPTPTTTTVSDDVTTPTTTVSVQSGSIIWQGETVTAAPGEEVSLSFIVKDPNNTKLEIGGAQFVIDAEGNVKLVGATGSEAYGATFQQNTDTKEFAFANAKGTATVGPDGSSVITLTFQVPEDAKDGDVYDIGMSDLFVSDSNGNDITDHILVMGGQIKVVAPVTTTTTVSDDVPTPTTTTVSDDVPTPTTTTVSDDVPTPTTTTVSDDVPTPTTTTVSDDVSTPTTTTVSDDVPTPTTTTVSDDVSTPTTTVSDDVPTPTTTTVSDDVPTPTTTTSDNGVVSPGDVTTSSTKGNYIVADPDTTVTVAVVDGYFFSHDPRSFPAEMVTAKYVLEDGQMVTLDPSKVTFADTVNGGGTPMEAYRASETDFTYELNVFYNGEPLCYEDGKQVVATAYIGVKGDSDLSNVVDASDASNALAFYAKVMTGGVKAETPVGPESANEVFVTNPELQELAAFLVDVDKDCYSKGNWALTRADEDRIIDASDASSVLKFYANVMTGVFTENQAHENWIDVLGDNYKESFDKYALNGTLE